MGNAAQECHGISLKSILYSQDSGANPPHHGHCFSLSRQTGGSMLLLQPSLEKAQSPALSERKRMKQDMTENSMISHREVVVGV